MFERFTERARLAITQAQEEARALQHNYVGPEHLLLGLLHDSNSLAAATLKSVGVRVADIREQVVGIVGHGKGSASGHIPFTPQSKKVLELSLREALQIGNAQIGTEHILLAVIGDRESAPAQVFAAAGVSLDDVRQHVLRLQAKQEERTGRRRRVGRRAFDERAYAFEGLYQRMAAAEQWVGLTPDLAELGRRIEQLRQDKDAALDREDLATAAILQDREDELRAERVANVRRLAESTSLADEVAKLRDEVDRLQAALREHGIDPGDKA